MKNLFVLGICLFVFMANLNAVNIKSETISKKTIKVNNETKIEKPQRSSKAQLTLKQYDCDVTIDLSEDCCDGSSYLSFCTTHFCNPGGMTTDCYSYGDPCPICPPQ